MKWIKFEHFILSTQFHFCNLWRPWLASSTFYLENSCHFWYDKVPFATARWRGPQFERRVHKLCEMMMQYKSWDPNFKICNCDIAWKNEQRLNLKGKIIFAKVSSCFSSQSKITFEGLVFCKAFKLITHLFLVGVKIVFQAVRDEYERFSPSLSKKII